VAAIILITIVLPAEYGLDPTGIGQRLGLFRPRAQAIENVPVSDGTEPVPAGATLVRKKTSFRSDEMSLVLAAGEGAEIKAVMAGGDSYVYAWTAEGGPVDVDMHGEPANAQEGEIPSYFKDEGQSGDNGVFRAPVAGRHGWFWQNLNDTPVTIRLRTSGFYERLMRP
jgi:hypothetical protein